MFSILSLSEDSEPTTVLAPVSRGWRSERTRTTTPNFSARLEGKGLLQNGYLKYRRKKKKAGGGEKGAQSESRLLRQPRPGALRNRTTPRHGRPDAARRLCPELRALRPCPQPWPRGGRCRAGQPSPRGGGPAPRPPAEDGGAPQRGECRGSHPYGPKLGGSSQHRRSFLRLPSLLRLGNPAPLRPPPAAAAGLKANPLRHFQAVLLTGITWVSEEHRCFSFTAGWVEAAGL